MLKTALKNYFVSQKYFLSRSELYFWACSSAYPCSRRGVRTEIKYVVENVNEIVGNATADYGELKGHVMASANELSWDNPSETLAYLAASDWLAETVSGYLDTISWDEKAYSEKLTLTARTAAEELKAYGGAFLILSLLGLFTGSVLTKFLIRRSAARRKFSKYILVTALDSLLR